MSCHSVSNNGYAHYLVRPCILTDIKNRLYSKSICISTRAIACKQALRPPFSHLLSRASCTSTFYDIPQMESLLTAYEGEAPLQTKQRRTASRMFKKTNAKLRGALPVVR